jgi:hypothetical protein
MQKMLRRADGLGLSIVSGDISGYDASIAPVLIEIAGDIMKYWCRAGELPLQMAKALANKIELLHPDGVELAQPSSMKSGSGLTNLVDTIILLLILFAGEELGKYRLLNLTGNGDDFLALGHGVTPDTISETFQEFGMDVHPDKQFYEPGFLSYLQRIHRYGYIGGAASTFRVLNSATSYERLKYKASEWNPYVDSLRALAQLENANFSPWFEDFVKFFESGDKIKLGAIFKNPMTLVRKAGDTGIDVMKADIVGAWHSNAHPDSFSQWAINGVLRGKVLPPLGSVDRHKQIYGERAKEVEYPPWLIDFKREPLFQSG